MALKNSVHTAESILELPSDQDASGRTLGEEEIALVVNAIRSGTLSSTKGTFVKALERDFARLLEVRFAYACSSGTAAIHCAIAALDPEPGDEIITSPITDMGALAPILYQGAIPVFADVDTRTLNVTAETLERAISDRTKGIIVTHLFGNPCDMSKIMRLGERYKLPVIEDCAQAFLATHNGRMVGTFGSLGCFSTQQGKHMTTGEGGLIVSNDPVLARRVFLFINKAWGYGDPDPDHYFLALNYRLSELQGAVALAQLGKLKGAVEQRIELANLLSDRIRHLPGIHVPTPGDGDVHTFWRYILSVDSNLLRGGSVALGRYLKDKGIAAAPRYIQKPAFECKVFREQRTFGNSRFPFVLARKEALNYSPELFPQTYLALDQVLVLPWNERYTYEDVDYIAACIEDGASELCR